MRPLELARLLDAAARWTLTPAGWRQVDAALLLLDDGLRTGDAARTRQGTTALLLAGPLRAARGVQDSMDELPRQPAPAQTRDLVDRLLHRIGRPAQTQDDDDETA